ncbi:MAG TPA: sensor histidine kinase [Micromonosporaceae bacterium]|nr:sensor histidine kinase [Micromonosporaceae bacterium]
MHAPARLRDRWRSIDRRSLDVLAALALFAFMAVELALAHREFGQHASTALAYLLAAAITLPFAVHRRHPVAVVAVSTWAVVVYALGHFSAFPGYGLFVLVFGVALHSGRRVSAAALGAVLFAMSFALSQQPAGVVTGSTWISTLLAVAVAWLSGENIRSRRLRLAVLEERARRLEYDREERARQAVSEERLRIARELHDVVAHSMSVIAIQAGVANHVIDSRPELARQALATVETHTRSALVEMRRLLGVLRQGDETAASLTPAPGLALVPGLVRQMEEAGLQVDLRMDGGPDGIPDGVELSAYRIVQEGLTNVLRHGGPNAVVTIGYLPGAVQIEIVDDGAPPGAARSVPDRVAGGATGHGLIGMRERAAVFGGTLVAEPVQGGGFRVAAVLPYAPAASVSPVSAVGGAG